VKTLISILTVLMLLGSGSALAGERDGRGGGGHGGGCGGGCGGGGHPGAGGGYNTNVNVNVNANANASAGAFAGAGAFINARAYDVGSVGPRVPVYGGVVSTGGDYGYGAVGGYGYGGGYGPVVVTGAGYGTSRPYGYVVYGFGRRYVTTDRCGGGCGQRPPPPPSCYSPCRNGSHASNPGGGHGQGYSGSASGSSYSVRERYSESAAYSTGYQGGYASGQRYSGRGDDGPRHAPSPYSTAPREPLTYDPGYAPPAVHYGEPAYAPSRSEPGPVDLQAPAGYYGDLPPGDAGEGTPYRQEPGERG